MWVLSERSDTQNSHSVILTAYQQHLFLA